MVKSPSSLLTLNTILVVSLSIVILYYIFTIVLQKESIPERFATVAGANQNELLNGTITVHGDNNQLGPNSWIPHSNGNTYLNPGNTKKGNVIIGDHTVSGEVQLRAPTTTVKDLDLQNTLYFGKNDGSSDPYSLKKLSKDNKSSLRLTINDDKDETFEIWGGSCDAGNCGGDGKVKHKFQANGDASHEGDLHLGTHKAIRGKDRLHITSDELIYLLSKDGVTIGREWGGSGHLRVQGDIVGSNKLCLGSICMNGDQLNALLKKI